MWENVFLCMPLDKNTYAIFKPFVYMLNSNWSKKSPQKIMNNKKITFILKRMGVCADKPGSSTGSFISESDFDACKAVRQTHTCHFRGFSRCVCAFRFKMPLKFELCPGRMIGGNNPCFIIAEIGQNHQGDIEIAKKMIKMAKVRVYLY